MREKVTIRFDTSEQKDVTKTIPIDYLKTVENQGDSLYIEYYDEDENEQMYYCKSVEFHN